MINIESIFGRPAQLWPRISFLHLQPIVSGILARSLSKAGAQYLFPAAEHHGSQMHASTPLAFIIARNGAETMFGELRSSRKRGLHFCTSSPGRVVFLFAWQGSLPVIFRKKSQETSLFQRSRAKGPFDLTSLSLIRKEFLEDWLRTCELVRDYQPELLYF